MVWYRHLLDHCVHPCFSSLHTCLTSAALQPLDLLPTMLKLNAESRRHALHWTGVGDHLYFLLNWNWKIQFSSMSIFQSQWQCYSLFVFGFLEGEKGGLSTTRSDALSQPLFCKFVHFRSSTGKSASWTSAFISSCAFHFMMEFQII